MGWANFNLNLMQALEFEITTRNLILGVFDSASAALDDEWNKFADGFQKEIEKAYSIDEHEGSMLSQEKDWEEDLFRQRRQGVGALALDWLKDSLQNALLSAAKHLDATHPHKKPYKSNDMGWIGTIADEYQKRFGIDFKAGPVPFALIQELVLARNAGVHREQGEALKQYLEKVEKPVFVDDEDRFFVKRDDLVRTINESEKFLRWVVSEIEKLRPAKPPQ
jgi:hypothetical protein